ncbi:MAG: aminodeoxychorismate/anthranilate synthase component II [Rickettsiales bacterium]|nr:aminodeoxychorismate/anthranilate synthase component II [Rickettsiales bacterium]
MTKLLLIDNYDSFTYNLLHYFAELGADVEVIRNDAVSAEQVLTSRAEGIVISPGPSNPDNAGICLDVIKQNAEREHTIPLLGVCLGHQAIGQAFGGKIIRTAPMHGKTSPIQHGNTGLFADLKNPLEVTRYHSLIVERASLPDSLHITAQTVDGIIMGLQHRTLPFHGVQFHPESIASQQGHELLDNFLKAVKS